MLPFKIRFIRKCTLGIATLLPLFCLVRADAAERWIRLTTPHFEMYTTNGEKQARAALAVFEQVRYFFLQNSQSKSVPDDPMEIIAFRSEKEYQPYRFNEGAFAYYVRSRKVDYIVMQDINSAHYEAAVHEYTHLFVEHLNWKLPVWINEGLADLYSSLESEGNRAVVGRPLAGREMELRSHAWLDMNVLFAVESDSPYYNKRDEMPIFYAQSWALTHMLALGKSYRPEFPKFLAAVASGRPVVECFQAVYGKTLAEVTQDFEAYVHQRRVQAEVFDVKLTKADMEPVVSEPSQLSVELALANLLASQKETLMQAAQRLSKLAADHPDSVEVEESLGYLAWDQGDPAKAKDYFKLAAQRGSKNPQMLMQYAQLLHQAGAPADQVLPLLQAVVEIKPDSADAWLNLGTTATAAGRFREALAAFSHLKSVSPDHACGFFLAQAVCYWNMKSPDQARMNAERAKQFAKTPDEKNQIASLLKALATDSPAVAPLSLPRD